MIFDCPVPRDHRRHGPAGYSNYKSYRSWLRDEFTFRCVYCLKRETWGQVTGEFDIDHFQPQKRRPELAADYSNLLYACRRCNSVKRDQPVLDPWLTMTRDRIETMPDGTVRGRDDDAKRLILQLDLNSRWLVDWRLLWMRVVDLARERDPELLQRLIGFPNHLPDLRRLRPPGGNTRPEGIRESWAELAKQGCLPDFY